MTELLCAIGILAAVLGSALYSGAETGSYALSRVRLQFNLARRRAGTATIDRLLRDRQHLICMLLLGTNISLYLVSYLSQLLLSRWGEIDTEAVSTIILTPILFVFAEAVPKNAFRIRSDPLLYLVAPLLRWSDILLWPLTSAVSGVAGGLSSLLGGRSPGQNPLGRRSLEALFHHGEEEGLLSGDQRLMAGRIVELRHLVAASVMVPIREYPGLDVDADREAVLDLARGSIGTRVLVHAGSPLEVLGMVHLYDVLLDLDDGPDLPSRVREVPRLAPDTPLTRVLDLLVSSHLHLVLIEERGRALGVVTTKDVVEEIVGELRAL